MGGVVHSGRLPRSSWNVMTVRAVYRIPDHGRREQDGGGTPRPRAAEGRRARPWAHRPNDRASGAP
ncbi:predicted protein [Streptomyces viridosporus ATCC 14672]|uniref:Predicted protein n=1 Tax=Streptomyces viridosporus (strain ATCC 14672 / DSM 40746 / JCM 4963 / KCTC 9882 / NRRL B-12104 / FH 1290) TaxID=566461 RepID=D6A618_STRV1|nr:predicted protein [Streptomyces viridosporus ATCC 14672]